MASQPVIIADRGEAGSAACDHDAQAANDFAEFFEQSNDLLCVAGLDDGHFKRLNPAWTTCLGWNLNELMATPFIDFVHPDDRELTVAEFASLAAGEETLLFENRYRKSDGNYRWLRWNARSVPLRNRVYAVARDVTQQKRQEREILGILDHERSRLGRELHDSLCQNLAGIAALSSRLSRSLSAETESDASVRSAEITQLLHETIGEAQDLARGLGGGGLEEADLDVSLQMLASNVERRFDMACAFHCNVSVINVPNEITWHLYRIAQEAAHNGVVHGCAARITIDLTSENDKLVMRVRDNGVGIPETFRAADGIGMHTMAYRARLIGGSLDVKPRARCGTVVTCTVPLPKIPDTGINSNHVVG